MGVTKLLVQVLFEAVLHSAHKTSAAFQIIAKGWQGTARK